MPAVRVFLILASALMLLAACGTRGPLTLPPMATIVAPVDHTSSPPETRR
ncbi:MAG TPA: lipoprotein [Rhodocyclaceae bacterium]|nr:lipoprotein [Rhodocyclaceae bacterium]